ncbi:MAG: hypothetical protein AAFN77_22030 [Planctomycetota bacterium]
MVSRFKTSLLIVLAALVMIPMTPKQSDAGDIIELNLLEVDPSVRHLFFSAEKFWEDRISAYSYELPNLLRSRITALEIVATVESIDGPGGTLGAAGPDATISLNRVGSRPYVVAVRSSMFFDIDDFASLEADGILEDVIIHEMGHALGFGSLWVENELIEEILGVGETQYFGPYGLNGFAQDTNNPTVTFVPIQQPSEFVGPGTALSHWDDAPPFFNQVSGPRPTKEIMTGFLCDADPNGGGGTICAPKFLARASLGAMADLGFAVNGFNGQFAAPRNEIASEPWPKFITPQTQNNLFNSLERSSGLRFDIRRSFSVLNASVSTANGSGNEGQDDRSGPDPYNLRNHNWAK